MRATKCKVFNFNGDEGAPLVAVGILLNLNANQSEKRGGGGEGREGQEARIEGKHPQNSAVAYATSRYVLVNTGVLDTAFTDFPSVLRSFSRRLSASRYLTTGFFVFAQSISRSTDPPKEIYNLFKFICQTQGRSPPTVFQGSTKSCTTFFNLQNEKRRKRKKGYQKTRSFHPKSLVLIKREIAQMEVGSLDHSREWPRYRKKGTLPSAER